jgi:hypothetical protein
MTTTLEETEEKQTRSPAARNDDDRWSRGCALGGAAVWAGLAVAARMGIARMGAIELLFLFGPLVIVPLGMELGRVMGGEGRLEALARRSQPVGAALAVVAMWVGPGRQAAAFALGWMMICVGMAGGGLIEFARAAWGEADRSVRATRTVRVTLAIARIDLAVGGAWLVASRMGMRPMGIQEPIGLLTAVHFHFAGFATATIAAATLAFVEKRAADESASTRGVSTWLRGLVLMVIGMPYVVAAGFMISPAVKMTAAILFALSVAGLAVFLRACGRRAQDSTARVLLQVAAGAVFAGMILAGMYAVANFRGSDALTIPQMARTHGILNAVGFCLPALLGWIVETSGEN